MPYEYYATVSRVLDGDTVEVDLDLGFDTHIGPKKLRFFGLNAPEIHDKDPAIQARANAAMEFILGKLLPGGDLNPKIKVQTQKPDSTEKYGRILGTVFYLPPPPPKPAKKKKGQPAPAAPTWINLNEELLAAGHAKPYTGQGEKPV